MYPFTQMETTRIPTRQSACLHRLRMKDLLYGSFEKLDSHENDDHGNSKSGDILDAPVSKGVVASLSCRENLNPTRER